MKNYLRSQIKLTFLSISLIFFIFPQWYLKGYTREKIIFENKFLSNTFFAEKINRDLNTKINELNFYLDKYLEKKDYKKAEDIINILKDIYESNGLNETKEYALLLNQSGIVNTEIQNYVAAEKDFLKAYPLFYNFYDDDNEYSKNLLTININIAQLYIYFDSPKFGEKYAEEALRISEKLFKKSSHQYFYASYLKARLIMEYGDLNRAEKILNDLLKVDNSLLKKKKYFDRSSIYNSLYILSSKRGNLSDQKYYLLKEKEYLNKNKNKNDNKNKLSKITNLNNLSFIYSNLGEYKKAIDTHIEVLNGFKSLPNLDKEVATAYNNLGYFYNKLSIKNGDKKLLNDALKNYRKGVEIYENIYKNNLINKNLINIYSNIGLLYSDLSDNFNAEYFLKKSLDYSENLRKTYPDFYFTSINNLAVHFTNNKKHSDAKFLFDRAQKFLNSNIFLKDRTKSIYTNYLNIAFNYYGLNDIKNADFYWKKSNALKILYLQKELPKLPLDDRYKILVNSGYFEPFWDITDSRHNWDSYYFVHLNSHGLLQDIERKQYLQESNQDNILLIDKINSLNQKLSNINIQNSEKQKIAKKVRSFEDILYRNQPELKPYLIDTKEIFNALDKNSILVDFMLIPEYRNLKNNEIILEEQYVAFVLDHKRKIKVIKIGKAEDIDSKIREVLFNTKYNTDMNVSSSLNDDWAELSQIIINPLLDLIDKKDIIYFSPASQLNNVPFLALNLNNQNNYLVDKYQIRLLSSGKDLLTLKNKAKINGGRSLVVANPDFDFNKRSFLNSVKNVKTKSVNKLNESKFNSNKLGNLNESQVEGETISRIINSELFTGSKANTNSVLNFKNPKLIHFATHSQFEDEINSKFVNPLVNSKIALAGANNGDEIDDGYLSALELVKMDLSNTEMVVVAGCDSGKGLVNRKGEYVYGLKRSIAVAGARSNVLTLWPVDDKATSAFMISFYKRLKKGESRYEALINTQKDFRSGIISSEESLDDWSDIFYWGAFQLNGDWRSIDFS